MLEHHTHMLADFVDVDLWIRDVLSVKPDLTASRSLQ